MVILWGSAFSYERGTPVQWHLETTVQYMCSSSGESEDRIRTGPPRARTEVLYVDIHDLCSCLAKHLIRRQGRGYTRNFSLARPGTPQVTFNFRSFRFFELPT